MSIHELASRTAAYLARELEIDHSQELRIAFGLELFLGEIVELFCLLILAYIMGIFSEVIVITAAASLLRLASGGEHCSEFYRCLIGGTLCFLLLGWAVHILNPLVTRQAAILIASVCCLAVETIFWRFAPGDTENKPITDEADKLRYKKWSLILGALYLVIMLSFSGFDSLRGLVLPMAAGMMEQSFTVTPWGYRFLHCVDRVLNLNKWGKKYDDYQNSHR